MKLRKLSAFLLLFAATANTFAQSADMATGNNSTTLVSVKSVEKSAKAPAKVPAKVVTDSTKKASVVVSKTPTDTTKKIAAVAPKATTDVAKKPMTETSKTTTDVAKKPVVEMPKATTDATKKTVAESPKTTKATPSVSATKETTAATFNPLTDNATVRNATVLNGDKDDFSPIFFENGLLYCSNSRKAAKNADKSKVADDLNLKFALLDSLGNLAKPGAFSRRTNSKTHEGPSCFSLKGDTMFLTRVMSKGGVAKENKEGETTLKIYIKIRDKEGNFLGDEVMPFESETYSYCHPTMSADGQRLYFSSNMPGGFGGMDLWMTRKLKTGGWSQAMNLGARINTAGNEVFPYITQAGAFYFSSNSRKGGKGLLDIYRVDIENKIARPVPLGDAFNTEGDDFGIMFLPTNERKGYFSSNRKGGSGGDDIYEFEFK
jgi:hypothetical protein